MFNYNPEFLELYEELNLLYEDASSSAVDTPKKNFLSCKIDGSKEDYAILHKPKLLNICQNSFKSALGNSVAAWPCDTEVTEKYVKAWQTFLAAANIDGAMLASHWRWANADWQQRLKDSFLALETRRDIKTLTGWHSYSELVNRLDKNKTSYLHTARMQELGYSKEVSDFLANSGIYAIKNKYTGQLYIGKSYAVGRTIARRLYEHKSPEDSAALYLVISSNIEAFEWAVLDSSLITLKNFNNEEAKYIAKYNTLRNLFDLNMRTGGDKTDRDPLQRSVDPKVVSMVSGLLSYQPSPHTNPYARTYKYRAGVDSNVIRAYDLAFVPEEALTAAGQLIPPGVDFARAVLVSMLEQGVLSEENKKQLLSCKELNRSLSGHHELGTKDDSEEGVEDVEESTPKIDELLDESARILLSIFLRYNISLTQTLTHNEVCSIVQTEFDKTLRTRGYLFDLESGKKARQAICAAISNLKQNSDQYLSKLILVIKSTLNRTVGKEQLLQFFTDFEKRIQVENLKFSQLADDFRAPLVVYLWFTSRATTSAELFKNLTVNLPKSISDEYCRNARVSLMRSNNCTKGIRGTMRKFAKNFSETLSCSYEYCGEQHTLHGEALLNTIKLYLSLWIMYLEGDNIGALDQYALDFQKIEDDLPQLLNRLDELEATNKEVNK
jgi:hypothetical protein